MSVLHSRQIVVFTNLFSELEIESLLFMRREFSASRATTLVMVLDLDNIWGFSLSGNLKEPLIEESLVNVEQSLFSFLPLNWVDKEDT